MLGGMPEAADLRHTEVGGQVVVSVGTRVVSSFPAGDSVMRNMAAVTLTELGFTGRRVGAMFGIPSSTCRCCGDGPAATARRG